VHLTQQLVRKEAKKIIRKKLQQPYLMGKELKFPRRRECA